MAIQVYKEYLDYLNNLKNKNSWAKKSFFAVSVVVLLGTLTTASSIYYINTKIVPKKQALNYLNTVKNSVVQTAHSLNDVTAIYKVAGVKTQIISSQNESTPSALGFNTTIDDIQKSINGLESARKNIEVQKNNIAAVVAPGEFQEITNQANDYMYSSEQVLDKLKSRLAFYKQIQLVIGPNLYLPKLEADNLWGKLNKNQLQDYYQKTSDDALSTTEKLSKITPPNEFKSYYDAQGKYLDLVRDVSENIVKILSIEDQKDINGPTQTEKAYQLFLGASAESKNLTNLIDIEKTNLHSATETINSLAEVHLKQQALEIKLNDYSQSAQNKASNNRNLIEGLLENFTP